ncbi:AAA domain-containing protein [Butyrivibrio sp. WCD3002]|uniref:AAA domain-containing protein n=1 Tax=Butyrivibrio sp. WCD3002 TaxID=1280676 RepID=UPI000410807D|nr:AAA domain-containing protein [Butyrivibrio sp. WCD3002]
MNPIIVAGGIYLSAKIIKFISDEMSETDQKKQQELKDKIEQMRSAISQDNSSEERFSAKDVGGIREEDITLSAAKDIESKREKNISLSSVKDSGAIREKQHELYDYLKSEIMLRKQEYNGLYDELEMTINDVIAEISSKNSVKTPLRMSSLELLLRQLLEAKQKCNSYIEYLVLFQNGISLNNINSIDAYQMKLPEEYPYVGKIIWISSEDVASRSVTYTIDHNISISVHLEDCYDEIIAEKQYPVMITRGLQSQYYASLEKGAFKAYELFNTHLGFTATVKEIQRKYVVLTYQKQLELYLSRDSLIKPDRFPPIRSSLTVYPVKWEYDLRSPKYGMYPVSVSERKEDASSSFSFKCFPICFSKDDLTIFENYYNKNKLTGYDKEFLIGPVSIKDCVLRKGAQLKLQLGDIPLLIIEVDEYADRNDKLRHYFRFSRLCDSDEKTFSADDIFVPFEVSLSPYYEGTSIEIIEQYMDIEDIDDVGALIWDIFEEFRIQNQIRKNRDGIGYFYKWENITSQLIEALEQGDSIQLNVNWIESENWNSVFADVLNVDDLCAFVQRFAQKADAVTLHEWKPQFFIKDEMENRFYATITDGGKRIRVVGKNVSKKYKGNGLCIELFAANYPYAEYQQQIALRQFRNGQVVNPIIQAACLNGESIISEFDTNKRVLAFYNYALTENLSQKLSVEKSFMEKNIFLIQGPPGTGKTTVIKELVEQTIDDNADSRILIVSQANVAVDNVLSGLIKKYENQMVRCGNGNKISENLKLMRINEKCREYLDDLDSRKQFFDEKLMEEWREIILDDLNEYSPALFELILRKHHIIGATCVGLAKRNIGLERMEFDLVIIDEAGKALPAELLIPLIRAKKAVIIGDQRQLPPVINPILYDEERIDLEERAISENELFCHSFFERLYDKAPESSKMMLDTQYRMPAVIGDAISKLFYGGLLKNGSGTQDRIPVLFDSNLTFLNYDGNKQYCETKDYNNQISNLIEAEAAVSIAKHVRDKDSKCIIAVITPYKGQKRLIRNTFLKYGIHYQLDNIFVDTIDSFQGSEADVVLFCTTRSKKPTIFFKDSKRLNVALSRAKKELIILGKLEYFYKYNRSESCLADLADYIRDNGCIVDASKCDKTHIEISNTYTNSIMLRLDEISLPTTYYTETLNMNLVQSKIDEYYRNGDFLEPLKIKKIENKEYILCDCFEQYRAALDLAISECLCEIV